MPNEDVTPIRQQYLEIKRDYPNTILFFRLGDFYETFDEDAEVVSRELDIVLTSRPIGKGQRAPLAGIPYHALENYLSRLIEKGHHIAICEQIGDEPIKGIFPRKVVRVVTPGQLSNLDSFRAMRTTISYRSSWMRKQPPLLMPISPLENLPRPNCHPNHCAQNWCGFILQKSSFPITKR